MQKSIKKNTVYNAVKTSSSILFPLVTFPYVSRVLLPENIGKINFVSTFIGYFALIATLGITTYAIRECSASNNDKESLSSSASQIFTISMYTTAASYVFLAGTLIFFPGLSSYRTLIVITSSTIFFSTLGADWLNTAMEDFRYITLRSVGFQLISLIALFIFVKTQDDYIKYMLISVISSSGASVLNIAYRRRYCVVRFVKHIDWKRHMPPIILLFAMLLSQQILRSTDITMLGLMRGDYEVGIYSTAVRIINIVSQVVYSILWVLLPRLSAYFSEGKEKERNELLRKALCYFIGLGLPCITGLFVTANSVIHIIAGPAYMAAVPIMIILLGEFLLDLLGGAFIGNLIMLPSNNEKYFLYACIEAAVANVILNYLFIARYGMYAAAAATVISRAIMFISLMIHLDKSIKIDNLAKVFFAPFCGCLAIFIIASIVDLFISMYWINFIIKVGLAFISYVIVLWILKFELLINVLAQVFPRLKR